MSSPKLHAGLQNDCDGVHVCTGLHGTTGDEKPQEASAGDGTSVAGRHIWTRARANSPTTPGHVLHVRHSSDCGCSREEHLGRMRVQSVAERQANV